MTVERFVSYDSAGKCRIFALISHADKIEVVTTVGSRDQALTEPLVGALNDYLATRSEVGLDNVLGKMPAPVSMAVHSYLRGHTLREAEAEAGDSSARKELVRELYYGLDSPNFLEQLEAAYTIGLGVRVASERVDDGSIEWTAHFCKHDSYVPATLAPRAWPLPQGIPVLQTWTSQESTTGNPVAAALEVARAAASQGNWVRMHTVEHDDGGGYTEGVVCTCEWVVDILDAAVPDRDLSA
ncbi:hypothetical protein JWS13_04105 (plasmid) [Rhodococcus pseudokoreensis]|uniref:Uncharacterized protein n=1 Tax=Rhodococcus pseudokoreensis TaxID=2811421 RepID=A0A974ZRS8_9NOCA|nr:hypothetical protein [Rhodococcus pseudokoreensis]QSE87849.1 hypothetical protein JWS13_04105 [Rhodococcus pseudokoreensis]